MSNKNSTETAPVDGFTDDGQEIFKGEIVEYEYTELSTITSVEQRIIDGPAPLPATLEGQLDLHAWYDTLAKGAEYADPDPNAVMRKLLLQTANAKSAEELFERTRAVGLQELIPNRPGAGSGPVDIFGLHVAASHLKGGVKCFMVLDIASRRTGESIVTTTGAQEFQMQVLGFLAFGVWPIPCQIKRMDVQDKGGRYMFRLYPLD